MKYAIIGGGIAGLYSAIELIIKFNVNPIDITIYEKTNRWGGRIQTETQKSYEYHCGAGRFKKNHINLLKLIKRYGLEHKIYSFDKRKEVRFLMSGNLNIIENKKIQQIISKLLKYEIPNSETIRAFDYFETLTDNITTQIIKTAFGYDAEFDIQNASATISAMKHDFHINSQYYSIQGYLEQIIHHMVDELSSLGVKMLLNCRINHIIRAQKMMKYYLLCNQHIILVDNVIFALDKNGLLRINIPILNPIRNILTKSISSVPLCRIYAAFPKSSTTGKVWFSHIRGTIVSNTRIRQFIPYDITSGFCVISYTDGSTAEDWNKIINNDDLSISILHELDILFPDINEPIPKPIFIKKCYWQHGCHVWNLGYNMNELYSQIIHPIKNENIYICGEAYSCNQGWIEGALISVNDMLDKMFKNM